MSSRYKIVVLTRKLHADLAHDKLSCVNTNCLVLEIESDWESYRGCLYSLSYAHILCKKELQNSSMLYFRKCFAEENTERNTVLELKCVFLFAYELERIK